MNLPPALTWMRRSPWHCLFDYRLIERIHDHGVPTGMFYRDIHWVFERAKAVGMAASVKQGLTPIFARDELRRYERSLDVMFLPHVRMGRFLPGAFEHTDFHSLPPGGDARDLSLHREAGERLRLLYVGNIAPPIYDLRPYLGVVEALTELVDLQIITRERALRHHGEMYRFEDRRHVSVAHAQGEGLAPYYEKADVALCVWRDTAYHSFVMPVKIFEAISYGVPVVVMARSEVLAEFVRQHRTGWVIEDESEFAGLLKHLAEHPDEIKAARERVIEIRECHTWEARAREVVEVLREVRGRSVAPGAENK